MYLYECRNVNCKFYIYVLIIIFIKVILQLYIKYCIFNIYIHTATRGRVYAAASLPIGLVSLQLY